jgi:hypothetical protein
VSDESIVQDSCGCVYLVRGRERLAVNRCPVHGHDDPTRSLFNSDGFQILTWDAGFYFRTLLDRLEQRVPEDLLDPELLDDVYRTVRSKSDHVGSYSTILALLVRSAILTQQDGGWRFVHRWVYNSETEDYDRR